ncbi:MAG: tRNA pseudouridine(55) synthase TruB [Deltaproteobacteria bacterium]|nr:tRNA pseudouridine(55) synthase TruB [Deltaproteobacteria bacterium]
MNGVLVVDKPAGRTSFAVVSEVKKRTGARKAGHTGTLDPLATGVLPVCLNEATKLASFLALDSKDYRATMLLGVRTDTEDIDGSVLSRVDPDVSDADIHGTLGRFLGRYEQKPPRYSALKHQGRPLYKWARKGIVIDPPPRTVEIQNLEVESVSLPYVTFHISCSKGTYIRSLCAEAGDRLGCGACLAALRRMRSGAFTEASALAIGADGGWPERDEILRHIIPMADALPGVPAISVDANLAVKLRDGYQPVAAVLRGYPIPFLAAGDMVSFVDGGRRLVAAARMLYSTERMETLEGGRQAVKILRVFNG